MSLLSLNAEIMVTWWFHSSFYPLCRPQRFKPIENEVGGIFGEIDGESLLGDHWKRQPVRRIHPPIGRKPELLLFEFYGLINIYPNRNDFRYTSYGHLCLAIAATICAYPSILDTFDRTNVWRTPVVTHKLRRLDARSTTNWAELRTQILIQFNYTHLNNNQNSYRSSSVSSYIYLSFLYITSNTQKNTHVFFTECAVWHMQTFE